MDGWIQNRRSDVRFFNEMRRVDMKKTHWYNSGQRFVITNHTFAAKSDSKSDSKPDPTIKKKKKKQKKKTESGNEKSATSDGSDTGICWSDYERVPGTAAGSKGSCRPKSGSKK